MITQEFPMPPMEEMLNSRGIQPIDLSIVRKIHETDLHEAQKISHGYDDASYQPVREAERLLTPGQDYAELPGYRGQTPTALLQGLPIDAKILDVGCADGSFGHNIVDKINQGVSVYGFDARTMSEQKENLVETVIGNVYDLNQQHFPNTDFDLVLSSALIYHLSDPLLGIFKMADMVKKNGLLLLSTIPRVINSSSNEWIETEHSIIPVNNMDYRYFGGHNFYDSQGRLIPSRELVNLLGEKLGFDMQYSVATAQNSGAMTFGGQISGKRSYSPSDSVRSYYCQTDGDKLPRIWKNTLGYLFAKTEQEAKTLQKLGYTEIPSRG
jgi:2-polyprenyl-3-methyl-5-hydroxy-6-metoxy-1,4-benzoquinol methylase